MENLEILKLFPEAIFKYKFEKFKKFNPELSKYIYDLKMTIKVLLDQIKEVGILKILILEMEIHTSQICIRATKIYFKHI